MLDELARHSSLVDYGMWESIRLILEMRFGPVDPELMVAIEQVDEEELRELVKLSVSATLPEIRARLGLK